MSRATVISLGAVLLSAMLCHAEQANPEVELLQGQWRILAVYEDGVDRLANPKYAGSTVSIAKERFDWKPADGPSFLTASFQVRPAMKDNKMLPPEIDLVKDGKTFAGRYVLEKDIFRMAVRIKESPKAPDPRTNQVTTRPQFLSFILERIDPKKPAIASSNKKDEERILGTWDVVAYFDDADDYTNRGRILVVTKDRLEWKKYLKTTGAGVAANYQLHPEKQWIDLLNTKGGNPPPPEDGFLPSIYRFLDDDTLLISWPESGWRKDTKPADRARPKQIGSDGDVNLWILRRRP